MKKEIITEFISSDGKVNLPVLTDIDDVWLSRNQIASLFDRDYDTITKHIQNALEEECRDSTPAKFAVVQTEGSRRVERYIEHYNLDVILSVGYRVKSKRGIEFRRWANQVLKARIAEIIQSSKDKIKELIPYKQKVEHQEYLAYDYRVNHVKTRIQILNFETGKISTLWNIPIDVHAYLSKLSKRARGLLYDRWKRTHNFNEFVRYRMKKEGFVLK